MHITQNSIHKKNQINFNDKNKNSSKYDKYKISSVKKWNRNQKDRRKHMKRLETFTFMNLREKDEDKTIIEENSCYNGNIELN